MNWLIAEAFCRLQVPSDDDHSQTSLFHPLPFIADPLSSPARRPEGEQATD